MTRSREFREKKWILILAMIICILYPVTAATDDTHVLVSVRDAKTGQVLEGAMVYLDGGYRNATSSGDNAGTIRISGISEGKHTIRVTMPGYLETMKRIVYPDIKEVDVALNREALVSLMQSADPDRAINVVFYPSGTAYNCTDGTKIPVTTYTSDEEKFRHDVLTTINNTYLSLDRITDKSNPLPVDYQNRFNFYYYYDPSAPADAFSGCAGTIPTQYWDEVSFSDITVILYPTYCGIYTGNACQPTGCFQSQGPGQNVMKAPADRAALFAHETGHAVFGLLDTYCGDTYYYENDPYPNVWSSEISCMADARAGNRDPAQCRQIEKRTLNTVSCSKNFWRWDPAPDIMEYGYSGKFGSSSTQRIEYVLAQAGSGNP
jgi:hypothetical protein